MRRVLLIDLSQRFGGADIRVCDVAARLRGEFEIRVAVLASGDVRRRLEAAGVEVFALARSRRDPRLLLDLRAIMRGWRPDVVDAHNTQSHLWGLAAARLAGIPRRIATIHSNYELSEKRGLRTRLYALYPLLLQGLATEAVAICGTVGKYVRERGFSGRPLHVIANGISMPDAALSLNKCERRPGRLRIAIVGRLVPVKGHVFLFEALRRLAGRIPEVGCVVIGDGPERERLERLSSGLGLDRIVRFLGHRVDVPELVTGSDVLCMPSLSEGLPYSALEAALLGIPIVASDVGGLAEAFEHGTTARLFPAGNVAALERELFLCAMNPHESARMGERARSAVSACYSLDRMIERTAGLYASPPPGALPVLSARASSTARWLGH